MAAITPAGPPAERVPRAAPAARRPRRFDAGSCCRRRQSVNSLGAGFGNQALTFLSFFVTRVGENLVKGGKENTVFPLPDPTRFHILWSIFLDILLSSWYIQLLRSKFLSL